jgi:hypothetical protein
MLLQWLPIKNTLIFFTFFTMKKFYGLFLYGSLHSTVGRLFTCDNYYCLLLWYPHKNIFLLLRLPPLLLKKNNVVFIRSNNANTKRKILQHPLPVWVEENTIIVFCSKSRNKKNSTLFATSFSRRKTTALPRYLWKKKSITFIYNSI